MLIQADLQVEHKQGSIQVLTAQDQSLHINIANRKLLRSVLQYVPLSIQKGRQSREIIEKYLSHPQIRINVKEQNWLTIRNGKWSGRWFALGREWLLARWA